MTDRAQTLQDYLLGISLVLLTIIGVFTFFPDVFVPFEEPVASEDREMATELADELVEANRTMRGTQTVNFTGLSGSMQEPILGRLVNRSGIPGWKQVNVTIMESNTVLVRGDTNGVGSVFRQDSSDPPATVVRTVQARNRTHTCAESCQLVVRVWGG